MRRPYFEDRHLLTRPGSGTETVEGNGGITGDEVGLARYPTGW